MSEYEGIRVDIEAIAASMSRYALAVDHFTTAATDEIQKLWRDNAELRDELHALANRLEALTNFVVSDPMEVASKIVTLREADDA